MPELPPEDHRLPARTEEFTPPSPHSEATQEHTPDSPGMREKRRSKIEPGQQLGKQYVARKFLGRGGMGEVWLADEVDEDGAKIQDVVVKIVPKVVQADDGEMVKVRRSFEIVRRLRHKNICPTLTLAMDRLYGVLLVMDYVKGEALSEYQAKQNGGVFTLKQAVEILTPLAAALDFAHTQQVMHRDIKPQNVMVPFEAGTTRHAEVQLIDFGLAAEIQASLTQVTGSVSTGISGTLPYMSPEQINGEKQDGRSDQYALAVTAYVMLNGALPFTGTTREVLIHQILHNPPTALPGLSDASNAALLMGLSKERKERFASCTDFVRALDGDPQYVQAGEKQKRVPNFDSTIESSRTIPAGEKTQWHWLLPAAGVLLVCLLLLFIVPRSLNPRGHSDTVTPDAAAMRETVQAAKSTPPRAGSEVPAPRETPRPETIVDTAPEEPKTVFGGRELPEDVKERLRFSDGGKTAAGSQVIDSDLLYLSDRMYVESVYLANNAHVTDVGLSYLKGMPWLKRVVLSKCSGITDECLASLSAMPRLEMLLIDTCHDITDAGLVYLGEMTQLKELGLYNCNQITDAGLTSLHTIPQLEYLVLDGCNKISDEGLAGLKKMTFLTKLQLRRCHRITDAGLAHLKEMNQLEVLHLNDCSRITTEGLLQLRGIPHLEIITPDDEKIMSKDLAENAESLASAAADDPKEAKKRLRFENLGTVVTGINATDSDVTSLKNNMLHKMLLTTINLSNCCRITDGCLGQLKSLPQLAFLTLDNCYQISDEGLASLPKSSKLWTLSLNRCEKITDAGLIHLKNMPQLTLLALDDCYQVTDAGLASLQPLTELLSLSLRNCDKITDAGLEHVKTLAKLKTLDLNNCHQITDVGLDSLQALAHLEAVSFNNCYKITDNGLGYLKNMPALQTLDLNNCIQITDAGLAHLKSMDQLKFLGLTHCSQITDQGVADLQKALPLLKIHR